MKKKVTLFAKLTLLEVSPSGNFHGGFVSLDPSQMDKIRGGKDNLKLNIECINTGDCTSGNQNTQCTNTGKC